LTIPSACGAAYETSTPGKKDNTWKDMTLGFPTILACIPIDRYKKIGTICIKDICLTAQSLALADSEDYPTSARLNQWQPETQTIVQ
jgi:hypothetical protein